LNITLINPPFLFPFANEVRPSQCLGLRSLSAVLKTRGHAVTFIDALREGLKNVKPYANGFIVGLELDEIARQVPSQTHWIGLSVPFSQLAPIAHDTISLLKSSFPSVPIVMGGVYPSTQPDLALSSQADYIVIGEGDLVFEEMASSQNPLNIRGVYAPSTDKHPLSFCPADMISNLDQLPFIDYGILGIEHYFAVSPRAQKGGTASIITSRGCPFACEFCSIHPVYGRRWRARSSGNVLEEIDLLYGRYGIKKIEFEDDNLTLDKERAARIFEGLLRKNEKGAGIRWSTPNGIRIDTLNEELIGLMKRSGCESLVLALEHGDPEMLERMNKKLDLDVAFRTIEWSVKLGVPNISLFVIVGYPGETAERFERGLKYLKRIHSLSSRIVLCPNIVQPYPGTKLLKDCLAAGYIKNRDIDNFLVRRDLMDASTVVSITTPDFDALEVFRRFYLLLSMSGSPWKKALKRIFLQRFIHLLRR